MPAQPVTSRSFAESFANRRGKRIGLIPFIPAGFPDLATTSATIKAVDAAGAAAIEIGFPFTDPIADGSTIQQAYTAALAAKIKVTDILKTVRDVSAAISAPLVAMVSYSIIFRYGPQKFLSDARSAGFSGLLVPDLPPPEAQQTCSQIRAAGLDTVLLVAPTTAPQRRREIAALCSGFVYYLSVSGITGARDELPTDIAANVQQLKTFTNCPVCVGFGISKPKHLAQLSGIADGAIVGSAIVKRMTESAAAGPDHIARVIGQYCQDLLAGGA